MDIRAAVKVHVPTHVTSFPLPHLEVYTIDHLAYEKDQWHVLIVFPPFICGRDWSHCVSLNYLIAGTHGYQPINDPSNVSTSLHMHHTS